MIDRRELMGMIGGAGLVGLTTLAGNAVARSQESSKDDHAAHLRTIAECAQVCNEAAHHCLDELRKGGDNRERHAQAHEMTMDCQAFCVLAGTLMARNSPLAGPAHQACAEACSQCAKACEGMNDPVMKRCVEACRACEKACRSMATHSGEHHDH